MLTIDSYAWLELIAGTARGARVVRRIEASSACFTPSIVLAEVARACRRDGRTESTVRSWGEAILEASQLVAIDVEIALGAARAIEELRRRAPHSGASCPGLADGIVLATARRTRSQVLTGDPHFRHLPETVWLE